MQIDVIATAENVVGIEGKGKIFVVIDAFRATSTIITALKNGCREVYPVYTVEEARELAEKLNGADVVFGGERNTLKIEGFHFGNSPLEYTADRVRGKTLIITTTNGTKAIRHSLIADEVVIAAFLNDSAVARYIAQKGKDVVIVCAGTVGNFTLEDALCAGGIVASVEGAELTDFALACRELYLGYKGRLRDVLKDTVHFQRLMTNGFEADVGYCLQEDIVEVVPKVVGDRILL